MFRSSRSVTCVALLLCPAASFAQISFNLTSIARPGDAAPVPPQLVQVTSVSLSDSGDVAFGGDNGAFLRSNGTTTIVAAYPDPSPAGGVFTYVDSPVVNAQGQVAFVASSTQLQGSGIFLSAPGGLQTIVRRGDPAPGGGAFLSFVDLSTSGDGGQLAFRGTALVFQSRRGLFLVSGSSIRLLAYAGDPAPRGGTFRSFFSEVVNASGQVAFYATLNPSGRGIFLSQPDGTLTAIARDGDPSPAGGRFDFGHPTFMRDAAFRIERTSARERAARLDSVASPMGPDGGATFTFFSLRISINDNGDVAFPASTTVSGRGGAFVFSNGNLTRPIREGDPLPGGGTIAAVAGVSLNSIGQIAFVAYLPDGIDHGVFLFSPDETLTKIARYGEMSPEGDQFTSLWSPGLNAMGQVAFLAELFESLGGAYLWSGDSIARVAGQGDPIDREPKIVFYSVPLGIDATGRVLFWADLFPGNYGLFLGSPVAVVARVGDPAPGGGVFDFVDTLWPSMNESGQVVFDGEETSITTGFTTGLYSSLGGTLSRIAADGDPAPGGGNFTFFYGPTSVNRSGGIAFEADASFPSRSGVHLFSNSAFRRLVALGDPAPGGGTFSYFSLISLNDQPQLALAASVTASGRPGLFRWSQDMVSAIAQTGDPAPGGGTFNFPFAPNLVDPSYAPSLNNSGDVAFGAPLASGDSGVFEFSGGQIISVVRTGDPAPVAGTIVDADSASLNDAGQVAFSFFGTQNVGLGFFFDGTPSAVALVGDPAPGGGTLSYVSGPVLNANMQVGFFGGVPEGYGAFLANPIR